MQFITQKKWVPRVIAALVLMVVSIAILSWALPKTGFVQDSLESIKESESTVAKFTGVTMGLSVAISALPDDIASPLAQSLADMSQYFVLILGALFFEKLLLLKGIGLVFKVVIPIACVLYALSAVFERILLKQLAFKLVVFGLALALLVPCSTHLVNLVATDYLSDVEETIQMTEESTKSVSNAGEASDAAEDTDDDRSFLDKVKDIKLTNLIDKAKEAVTSAVEYVKECIQQCYTSIAVLIVTSFVAPILNFVFLCWLLNELFHLSVPMPSMRRGKWPGGGRRGGHQDHDFPEETNDLVEWE
ncbi:MAG: hypothetical protein HUJ67_00175 [Ruminiclostridium sp.]|nr:hypothetical protein [Ruminiclostridium sp.]